MAFFDVFKKKKEKERFEKKQREKARTEQTPTLDDVGAPTAKRVGEKKTGTKFSGFSADVLESPHITEKNTFLNEKNVYVFKIKPRANKTMVKQAIKETYGVKPKKVSIVYAPDKKRFIRGKYGTTTGFKKAVIYLKEGDKIEIS
ncbi:50S ribosomal protein L23 [Patescibacteria group bacterium]|nr:50S ribosomal protein L23 [Patescibacteria group bacterium]